MPTAAKRGSPSCRESQDVDHRRADHQPAGACGRSTATRRPRCRLNAQHDRERFLRRATARAGSSTIYAATNEYEVLLELDPEVSGAIRTALSLLVFQVDRGTLVPLDTLATVARRRRAADHQSLRTVAGRDDFVQPASPACALGDVVNEVTERWPTQTLPSTITSASRARPRRSKAR